MKKILLFCGLILLPFICQAETWEKALAGILTTPPAEGPDGRIFCTAEDKALHSLNGLTGREYWSYRPGRKLIEFTIVSPDGTIFILTARFDLVAVSPGGWERWRSRLDGIPLTPPAVDSNGILYLINQKNRLISIDRLGNASVLHKLESEYTGLYAFKEYILLRKNSGFDIYSINGDYNGSISLKAEKVVIDEESFHCLVRGKWHRVDPNELTVSESEAPLPPSLVYPKAEVLITSDRRIVSGRNDWFMEAYKEGTESYNSLYQPGCNSSRTNGTRGLPALSDRLQEREELSLAFITVDPRYFSTYLTLFEQIGSFHELLATYPDYDLQLMDLISDSQILTSREPENPPEIDSYSLYRIYRILARWGDIRTRDILIRLCTLEEDNGNLAVLFQGLGKIGLDPDGKSLNAVYNALRVRSGNEDLYRTALESCLEIARYNGSESMKQFMEMLLYITARTRSDSTTELIKRISRSLSP